MPMYEPYFTKNPQRVARLQENYDEGVQREKIPTAIRDRLDLDVLVMTQEKLRFLHQNAMEHYTPQVKNEKVKSFNELHSHEKQRSRFSLGRVFS